MTREDRIKAFEMRLDGMTWEEIGACLGYEGQSVMKDITRVLERVSRKATVVYPNIAKIIDEEYDGSIYLYAVHLKTNVHKLRLILAGKEEPNKSVIEKIIEDTNRTYEEVFKE